MAPHSQAGGRARPAGSNVARRRMRHRSRAGAARCRGPAEARHSKLGRSSKTSATSAIAMGLPSRRHRANILVLDLGATLVDLADQHQDRLHHVQRLEAGDHDRLRNSAKNSYGSVPMIVQTWRGTDEAIDLHAPDSRASGLSRMFSIAEGVSTWLQKTVKLASALRGGEPHRDRGGRRGRLEADGEEHDLARRAPLRAMRSASSVE